MRPLNLKVKGFTAFRDEQEIDFTDLDTFVLWGPVGAGKSSVLDAITYALFGYVERVGNQVGQLVTHGQPRLSVILEFAIGRDAYRVHRSTAPKGSSKVLLEKRVGEKWESFGEGADLVREVNKAIESLLGLDYQAFTRSVVLPQGKFAEFLTGEPSKRREILTELLGLELFQQMGQRANQIARDAKTNIENKTDLLQREFSGVDSNALKEAEEHRAQLVEMLAGAETLEKKIADLEKRWNVAGAARKALASCITEVGDAAEFFSEAAIELDGLAKTAAAAEPELMAAREAVIEGERAAKEAAKKRQTAEGRWGSLEELAALRAKADSLDAARADHQDALTELEETQEEAAAFSAAVQQAANTRANAVKEAVAASALLEKAEVAHAEAHKVEAIGALVDGLRAGDPCPVCDRPLRSIPRTERKRIQAAKKAIDDARKSLAEAEAARAKADTALALATQDEESAKKNFARLKKEVTNRKGRVAAITAELAPITGKSGDPLAQIAKRIDDLRALVGAENDAAGSLAVAEAELNRQELAGSKIQGAIDKVTARMLGVPIAPMCRRVADAAPDVEIVELLPSSLPQQPDRIATLAATAGKALAKLAEELEELLADRERELQELIEETRSALPAGIPGEITDLEQIVTQARATTSRLRSDAAVAAKAVDDITVRLEAKRRYQEEISSHGKEQAVYAELAKELRSDRIVQHLQAEALGILARAAGEHLQQLSGDRYRLSYEDDRFFVIDSWNGDEKRNVTTLSGGETFQASLAFALALSEQVQFLAVTERGRLESLFLDEGFDTQDTETLDVVVDAIERLGSDGRLVGVITHVRALADNFPVRIEVTKTQRGSTLRRADQEMAAEIV